MGDPKNSQQTGDGFRFYRWTCAEHDPVDEYQPCTRCGQIQLETDVLSVTSIRKLCGEPFNLVNWQLANLADAALGTMKRTVIGPRGGVSEKRLIEEFPSEFAQKYDAAAGDQSKVDELRKWLREQADEPRNIAGRRGTIVHSAIEKNIEWDRIERPYVESEFARLSDRDRKKAKKGVQDEDVTFVRNAVRHYWHMRQTLPFVIIARECQVFNLTAGYAGSFDALIWLLGTFAGPPGYETFIPLDVDRATLPKARDITIEDIRRIGGTLVCADWKTSKDIHTDQVVQDVAYMSAEFVGTDGVIDQRLTDLLTATQCGALVHIRPNGWGFHIFRQDNHPEIVRAFLGSVAFARFLAKHQKPDALFFATFKGESTETDEEIHGN